MTALHIVTTSLAPASAAIPPAGAASEAGIPFVALLGEQLEAGITAAAEREPRDESPETATAAQAAFDPAALGLAPVPTAAQSEIDADAVSQWKDIAATGAPRKTEDPLAAADGRERKAAARGSATTLAPADAAEPLRTAAEPTTARHASFDTVIAAASNDAPSVTHASSITGPHSTANAAQPVTLQLQQPVGSERWNTELGQQVQLLIRTDQHSASLRVTPPELGPVDVRIDMSGDQATVSFTVQQADTRQALENALPRLRDLLAEGGILLGQAHVNQDSGDQRDTPAQSPRGSNTGGNAIRAAGNADIAVGTQRAIGLVDTFA
jgi:flagellar hook-length control protein FliK